MNKRGQAEVLQLSFLFEVLIAFAVAGMLVYSAVSFDVFYSFKKDYADADLTLLMDQVVSAPGPVEITYPLSKRFKVAIDSNTVSIQSVASFISFTESSLIISKDGEGNLDVRRES